MAATGAPEVVVVTWYDARYRGANAPLRVAAGDRGYTRQTAGFLLREDTEEVVVAMTFDGDQDPGEEEEVEDRMSIPTQMVKRIDRLGKTQPPRKPRG